MVHEAVVFVVNAVHDGIFAKAGKRVVHVPIDGYSGTPLLELCGLLSLTRITEPRRKEAVIRSCEELGDNGDDGQAMPVVEDAVVDRILI
ncbi:unnamed protein product [Heligmosomoides polygyrus]|uniref:AMP-binding domain-containing protein n=1 Tax=Heligmosomoides polygyrus TaxID=6339 RepID=A0A183G5F7_HELPZ|nr:unnamed protein product [Heligmosomoides polygyrus]